ncbi:hypothetical protein [Kribbella soli]|uniref:Uncharacterized protein n=1 Tax=Kribbella soli TaxID=1124743 RepID=A0A4R0GX26_9ACTN|nr:hypothetical protein [Kribbella soli]TCC01324.1 hypothetical protein E0H45_42145 [Kribbella soli]
MNDTVVPNPDRQIWYCISISWGGSPQDELIVTRDARLTMRRTVDYLARTGDFGGEWVRQHRPPDAATAPIADVEEWLEEFRENTDRPVLEWHRIPAPEADEIADLPGVIELPDSRPYDDRD